MRNKKLVHSPTGEIPLGEPVISETGQLGYNIRRKDSKGNTHFEFVPLDYLNCEAIKAVTPK